MFECIKHKSVVTEQQKTVQIQLNLMMLTNSTLKDYFLSAAVLKNFIVALGADCLIVVVMNEG